MAGFAGAFKDLHDCEPERVIGEPRCLVDAAKFVLGFLGALPQRVDLGHERVVKLAQAARAEAEFLRPGFKVIQVAGTAVVGLTLPVQLRRNAAGRSRMKPVW
jgi:hypothetical protein